MPEPSTGVPAEVGGPPAAPDAPRARTSPRISEDWTATIVGLLLVGLVLAGAITKGMIP
jgi:hypothetical protein